jgi:hypothetical protein
VDIARIVLTVLLIVVFATTGAAKILRTPFMVKAANHLGISLRHYSLIGVAEVAAAIGLSCGLAFPTLGLVTGCSLILLMIGATGAHLRIGDTVVEYRNALLCGALAAAQVLVSATWLAQR